MPYNPIASDTEGGAGGTCVLRGCVPKKLFVYASEYRETFADAQGFGCALPSCLPALAPVCCLVHAAVCLLAAGPDDPASWAATSWAVGCT